MSKITTHVLDTALGRPAAGVRVRLERMQGGGWIEIEEGKRPAERVREAGDGWVELARSVTDGDGRCLNLFADAAPGTYRLTFDTGEYMQRAGRTSIYPEISITFTCGGEAHYHLPLLVSDNGYTTYRGS